MTDDDHRRLFCIARNVANAHNFITAHGLVAGRPVPVDDVNDAAEALLEAMGMLRDSGFITPAQYDLLLKVDEATE